MNTGLLPWILGLCAALIVGLTKTGIPGMGILAAPLMVSVFPAKQSVGALLPMLIAADVFAVVYYSKHTQWRRLIELFPSVIAGMIVGACVLARLNSAQLKPLLGALILILLLVEVTRRKFDWTDVPHQRWFTIVIGALAGFATTVGNVAGPIMNIYLISKGLKKEHFMGTIAWYYFIINCTKVPIYLFLGMISSETLQFDLKVIPLIVVGALAGRWVLGKISQDLFKSLVLILAAFAAICLLF